MMMGKNGSIAKWLAAALVVAGSSAFGAVFTHVATISVGAADPVNGFNGTTLNGSNPLSVAFDGSNAYIGGYNITSLPASVGVVKVANVTTGGATLVSLTPTQFISTAPTGQRGIDALAYESATASLLICHDSGTASTGFITRRRASDGSLGSAPDSTADWTRGAAPNTQLAARPSAMAIDPIGDGSGPPGVAWLAIGGFGRRQMLKLSDGSDVYTISGGANPGGIINGSPNNLGNTWRAVAFDPLGNIAITAAYDGTHGGFQCGLRNNPNQWKTLDGLTVSATTSSISRDSTGGGSINVGQGVALLFGIGGSEPDLLACSARNASTFTPLGGGAAAISDTQVHIRNRDGSATGVAVTELTGAEDSIGTAWAVGSNLKNLAYGKDGSGKSYLLVLDFNEKRLDVYQVKQNPPACTRAVWADADGDNDVDQDDFGAFQVCFDPNATSVPASCVCLDRNHDNKVDSADFGDPNSPQPNTFISCHSGTGIAQTTPTCAGP